jgi:sugar phosphate permease
LFAIEPFCLFWSISGWLGMRGWHWLFILEGIPAVLLGIACLFVLTDRPEQAKWLNSQCHPRMPNQPSRDNKSPDSGEPIKLAPGIATINF